MDDLIANEVAIVAMVAREEDPLYAVSALREADRLVTWQFHCCVRRARRRGHSWAEIAPAVGIAPLIVVRRSGRRADVPFAEGLGIYPKRPIDWPPSVELTR